MHDSCLIFKTEKRNSYALSKHKNVLTYIHPYLAEVIEFHLNGVDIYNDNNIKSHCTNPEEILYYRDKFLYLEKMGILGNDASSPTKQLKIITPENVEYSFLNTQQIVFEITEKCNMQCGYCVYGEHYNANNERSQKSLSLETINLMLDYILSRNDNRNRDKLCVSFYGGEPLLEFSTIKKVIEYITHKYPLAKIEWRITTNATLLTGDILDFLIEKDFKILVSLDGNESNNSLRVFKNGNPTFDIIMNHLQDLKKKHPEFFQNNINFNAVLHAKNSVSEIYDFFNSTFGKKASIGELTTINTDKNDFAFSKMQNSSIKSHSANLKSYFDSSPQKKSLLSFLRSTTDNFNFNFSDLLIHSEEDNKSIESIIPTGTCFPFSKKIFITASGDIKPCEKIPLQFSLGSINERGILIDFENISNFYNSLYSKVWNNCSKCKIMKNCSICLFFINDILCSNTTIKCQDFHDTLSYGRQVSYLVSLLEENYNHYKICTNTVLE